ncbi:MAG: nitrogen regulation protein NR(I) [Proteobacteria bacterium]|nr:nitrogen regulation protein NR(I) [Pseudomonadota bacterium]MDA1355754.1 nitrogen regulation protein NR(I) [Pseudomonadota bacterium]
MNASPGERHATILVADDDRSIRTVLHQAMARLGHQVQVTGNVTTLWKWVEQGAGDLLITDVMFPDGDALDILPRIRKTRPDMPVIVMSARNTLQTAVRATERGAFDYLPKPFDLNEVARAVRRGLAAKAGNNSEAIAQDDESEFDERLPLIGRAPAMQEIYRTLARLMSTDLTVMIVGESGTGKELIARALHEYGKRRAGPFVAINMAAIPRELIESELFGHEKGAFTGAVARKEGRFEQAHGGTLFLDEVGDMPLEAQTRLLRVLQEGEFISVGGIKPLYTNVRIIAATHRNLRQMVAQGLFREDLFFRLNVVPLRLPPLRERKDDIALLMRHFLVRAVNEGLPGKSISPAAMQRLKLHDWPGNVRELENLARRIAVLHNEEIIEPDAIEKELAESMPPPYSAESEGALRAASAPGDDNLGLAVERQLSGYFAAHEGELPPAGLYDRVLREIERPLLTVSLVATGGNQLKAAKMLGINRNTLRKKIRDLDIRVIRGVRQDIDGIE